MTAYWLLRWADTVIRLCGKPVSVYELGDDL